MHGPKESAMESLMGSARPSHCVLESLPFELQVHILKSLQNIQTLISLIQASPRFFRVYQQARQEIISNVVHNHITPAMLPLAVNVLKQSYLRSSRRPRSKVLEFLETFKQPFTLSPNELSLDASKRLLKTHTLVEYFVDAYITERLSILSEYLPHITPLLAKGRAAVGIPGIESCRLTRAFYILELYGILFYDPDFDEDTITTSEQSSLFLSKLSDWEVEELFSVREYLFDGLSNFLDELEEDFLQQYIADGSPENIDYYSIDMRFEWDYEDWSFFSSEGQSGGIQDRWMDGCLTRGLHALRGMFQARTATERDDALGDLGLSYPRSTMNQALNALPRLQKQEEAISYKVGESVTNLDSPETSNDVWPWALKAWQHPRANGAVPDYSSPGMYNVLRHWGYVIWSNETLTSLGLLGKARCDQTFNETIFVTNCRIYKMARNPDLERRWRRRTGKTVEVRSRPIYESWRKEFLETMQSNTPGQSK